jgi:hypothetical protein
MTDSNVNSKRARRKSDYLDTFELPMVPDAPEFNLPERRLLCAVLNSNIQLALKGNVSSLLWLNAPSGTFVKMCSLLELDPSFADVVRRGIAERRLHAKSVHKNQYSSGVKTRAVPAPALPPDPAPTEPLGAFDALSVTVSPAPASEPVTEPSKAVQNRPVPSDGWIGSLLSRAE